MFLICISYCIFISINENVFNSFSSLNNNTDLNHAVFSNYILNVLYTYIVQTLFKAYPTCPGCPVY